MCTHIHTHTHKHEKYIHKHENYTHKYAYTHYANYIYINACNLYTHIYKYTNTHIHTLHVHSIHTHPHTKLSDDVKQSHLSNNPALGYLCATQSTLPNLTDNGGPPKSHQDHHTLSET